MFTTRHVLVARSGHHDRFRVVCDESGRPRVSSRARGVRHGFYRRGDENVSRLGLPFGPIANERGDGVSNLPERIGEFGFAGANSERDRVGGV